METAEAAWVLPGEPVPVRLMNTVWADRRGVHDALRGPADLAGWLAATGAGPDQRVPERELHRSVGRYRDLRDALRRLAALVTDDPRPHAASATADAATAVAAVNAAAAADPAVPGLALGGAGLVRADASRAAGLDAHLSALAADAVELLTGPAAARLRACHAPGCVLYFVQDHPRRDWCSTACGNRARAARHYRRHRAARSGS